MELSARTIHCVVHPTAAFVSVPEDCRNGGGDEHNNPSHCRAEDPGEGQYPTDERNGSAAGSVAAIANGISSATDKSAGRCDDAARAQESAHAHAQTQIQARTQDDAQGAQKRAVADGVSPERGAVLSGEEGGAAAWAGSQLNPKNRIDSLELLSEPLWKIDGCTGLGTQFHAIPLFFVSPPPPLRVDVFIPEPDTVDPTVRELLDLDVAFHTRDTFRVRGLAIARHVLRKLQVWTQEHNAELAETFAAADGNNNHDDDSRDSDGGGSNGAKFAPFEAMYRALPFGSRIVFENLTLDVGRIGVHVAPTHYLERQLRSVANLSALWAGEEAVLEALPPQVSLGDVQVLDQLHDSVCVVLIPSLPGEDGRRPWILKALTSYSKYLYHELHLLLRLEPHPNIIARPAHLVTKRCRFGSKTAVVGFTVELHAPGSLRDAVPLLQAHGIISLATRLRWAGQLASALSHIRTRARTYYPDLRLDNVVMSDAGDAVMVDFEQRGVWCEFAAPEVNAVEYVRLLAVDDEIPAEVRERYAEMLRDLLLRPAGIKSLEGIATAAGGDALLVCPGPEREEYVGEGDSGQGSWGFEGAGDAAVGATGAGNGGGYNIPWQCLNPAEQEAAEVYMLGRVLWCLFEGVCAPQVGAIWQSYRRESDLEFPSFRITPPPVRALIDECTRGRREPLSRLVVRRGKRLVMRSTGEEDAAKVQTTASNWWAEEVEVAETYLRTRADKMAKGTWRGNYWGRPKLMEVHERVRLIEAELVRGEKGAADGA